MTSKIVETINQFTGNSFTQETLDGAITLGMWGGLALFVIGIPRMILGYAMKRGGFTMSNRMVKAMGMDKDPSFEANPRPLWWMGF